MKIKRSSHPVRGLLVILAQAAALCTTAQTNWSTDGTIGWWGDLSSAPTNWTSSITAYIGSSTEGGMIITNGGTMENSGAYIGNSSGSTGTVTVTGTGSTWNNSGNLYVGREGTATVSIEDGGTVENDIGYIGINSGASGTVTVSGTNSVWNNRGNLFAGCEGTGTLNIENSGTIENAIGYIGYESGSTGTVTVTGSGSTWNNSSDLYVGRVGTATVSIEDGGTVENDVGYIGSSSDSTGTVTVTGTGSTWNNSDDLYVGRYGTGTLTIEDGGTVENNIGNIGYGSGSAGTVTVSGTGSTWDNSGNLYVGLEGSGTLTIEDGGTVISSSGQIGYDSGNGTVTVSGTGSTWDNSGGSLWVGKYGTGTLNIKDNGTVISSSGQIGYDSGNGTVTVSGTDSIWKISNDLSFYHGTLNLEGGIVSVGNSTVFKDDSTVNFELYDDGAAGRIDVDGKLNISSSAVLGLTTTGIIYGTGGTNHYELITAADINGSFGTTNIVSDYDVSVALTDSNLTATVAGVAQQPNNAPEQTMAAAAAANTIGQTVSKAGQITRSMVRAYREGGAALEGAEGPQVLSGEWVSYMRQFNDLGGLDSEGGVSGFDWKTHGFLIGLEKLAGDNLLYGVSGGGAWSDLDVDSGGGDGSSEMFHCTAYMNWFTASMYTEAGLLYAHAWNDASRTSTGGEHYTGDYGSDFIGGWAESGRAFWQKGGAFAEAYGRLAYFHGEHGGYTDQGGSSPMTVSDHSTDNLLLEAGLRGTREWTLKNGGALRGELQTGIQVECLDNNVSVNTTVLGVAQTAESPEADRAALVLGARLDWLLTEELELGAGYEPTFSGNWSNHALDFRLKYAF